MELGLYRSEIQQLIISIQENRGKDPTRTISECNELEKYGKEHKENALIGFARFTRGETYYLLNDMANFYREMIRCMEPFEHIGEWGYLAMANNMLGIMSLNRGNAPFAMDYYFRAINYCRQYQLRDLEWMIHMNMGALYLSVENFEQALLHFGEVYKYLTKHPELPDIRTSLAAVYVGIGKAYLASDDVEKAKEYYKKCEYDCLPHMQKLMCMPAYCLGARIAAKSGDEASCQAKIEEVSECFMEDVPIMDFFDDIYDYLSMLLDLGENRRFLSLYERTYELAEKTRVRNLERSLVILKIRYYRNVGDNAGYRDETSRFFEISELMERENAMMVSSMVTMRGSFYDLAVDHKKVEQQNKELQLKSETDPLTRMYNRLKINEYGEIAFQRAMRNKVGIAIEILDIDFFKEYNDNYGHQAGDKCIQFIANCILSLKRHSGIFCARYGGDEFVIIYEGYTDKETFAIAKELKKKVTDGHFAHAYSRSSSKYVTISQGIFWSVPEQGQTMWNFLHEADNLLYKVKTRSRNSIMLGTIFGNAERDRVMAEDGDAFAASSRDIDPEKEEKKPHGDDKKDLPYRS